MSFQKIYKKIEGHGSTTINKKEISLSFKIEIDSSSDISGEIDFPSSVPIGDIFKILGENIIFNIIGISNDGFLVQINNCIIYNSNHILKNGQYEIKDILIKAIDCTVMIKELSHINIIKYGVICLEIFKDFSFKYDEDNLMFKKLPNNEEVIKKIRKEHEPLMSAYIEVKRDIPKDKILEKTLDLREKINKLLDFFCPRNYPKYFFNRRLYRKYAHIWIL